MDKKFFYVSPESEAVSLQPEWSMLNVTSPASGEGYEDGFEDDDD